MIVRRVDRIPRAFGLRPQEARGSEVTELVIFTHLGDSGFHQDPAPPRLSEQS